MIGDADVGAGFSISRAVRTARPSDSGDPLRPTRLRLSRPSYLAGIAESVHFAHERHAFARLINVLPDGVALCETNGRVRHRNAALAALLAADREAPRLAAEISQVAMGAATLAERRALRDVRTMRGHYRLHASHVVRELLDPEAAVLVVVALLAAQELSPAELRARHGLTPREVEVTYLLARGTSNAGIARALGLSAATARHYTEHVLAKLGLHSRAQVADALRRSDD